MKSSTNDSILFGSTNVSKLFNAGNQTSENSKLFYFVTFTWPDIAVTTVSVILFLILLLTLTGNIAVIVVLLKTRALKRFVNNSLLVSLSVADLLVALLVIPCAIDVVITGRWRCGTFWSKFNGLGNFCFCISSIMHLMMLSMDRYVSILHPIKYNIWITASRGRVACVILWLYSTFWALLPLVGVSSYECFIAYIGQCRKKDWSSDGLNFVFSISVVSGTYGIALVTMCYVYGKIYVTIRSQVQHIKSMTIGTKVGEATPFPAPSLESNSKGVVTLAIVTGCYLVCWSPFCVLLFVEIARGDKIKGPAGMVTMFCGFANSACNPVIYAIKYRSFRKTLMSMVRTVKVPSLTDWGSNNQQRSPTQKDGKQNAAHTLEVKKGRLKFAKFRRTTSRLHRICPHHLEVCSEVLMTSFAGRTDSPMV